MRPRLCAAGQISRRGKEGGQGAHYDIERKIQMAFEGEFVPPVEVDDPVPLKFATEFAQTYLGYAKNDPRVYGKKWLALRARLYALLGSGEPLTISAGKNSYQLPPIDAANWRKPFEACGLGDSW
jgi:hypothetical protein